jgi:hypothetical protein
MITTETVEVKVSASNMTYWRDLGYSFPNPSPRLGIIPIIQVKVYELKAKSNVIVDCKCDQCNSLFTRKISNSVNFCDSCIRSQKMKNNTLGNAHKGKERPHTRGENHPRFNPNKTEFRRYASQVRSVTRLQNISSLKNSDKPRGLCGVEGAYQLDHITSIKKGFLNNVCPTVIGDIGNLQFIPWKENRSKAAH